MARAVDCGQLVVIEYLHEQQNGDIGSFALSVACANGNLRVAEYIYHHTTSPQVQTSTVAKRGHLHIIKFLNDHNIPEFTTQTMDEAAIAGHLNIVKYLRAHRQEGCTTRAMTGAAENGHTEVVLYLRQYSYKYFFRSVFRSINSSNKICVVQ
ncbi:hypothetical protein THRCLA_20839 [Thraustotheca clavata]|uniref:Uncharacterized protein n=1 Tax=Thraustotheca clavata TaxID=74557 RepID=A0A1W0A2W8_9STRA|nr:hypothetical protein THRCLA_20839 [Thraustotheca clavata]